MYFRILWTSWSIIQPIQGVPASASIPTGTYFYLIPALYGFNFHLHLYSFWHVHSYKQREPLHLRPRACIPARCTRSRPITMIWLCLISAWCVCIRWRAIRRSIALTSYLRWQCRRRWGRSALSGTNSSVKRGGCDRRKSRGSCGGWT